ncbi:stage II sporulation protein M [Nocardioides sp.]|uniref:stage II sporulation protein M n=1 Tax=Nocardioides sp. TaxID=35761 RepID=UPI0035158430
MDLDAYTGHRVSRWARLDVLAGQRRLTGAEADELVDTYEQVATDLSTIRTTAPDGTLIAGLSSLLARVRLRLVGTRVPTWAGVAGFFTHRFPAALYRLRWWWLGCLVVNVVVAAVMMLWLLDNPQVEQQLLSPAEVDQLVNSDFEGYYSEYAPGHFAAQVWTNNAWVAARCLVLGIFGLPVVLLLFTNMANVSVIGAIMIDRDRGSLFFGLILPHGLLELTAVFVAGGVGLRLFWSWIAPGALTRAQSIAREGRTAFGVALGLVVVLGISGIIEGFVTPSGLPTWARITIGVVAEVAFLLYALVLGRRAVLAGADGDLDPSLLEDRVATQA